MNPAPPPPAPICPPATATAWPRSAQLATAFLAGVALGLLTVHALDRRPGAGQPTEHYRIDLNRADVAELRQLPGIGPNLAERIDQHRRSHGPFASVDDLSAVPGIGPATIDSLRPWLGADSGPTYPIKAGPPPEPIDVNEATAAELQQLPGIGPILAQRIIAERQRTPFRTPDDLRRVVGIGAKTMEKVRPYVRVRQVAAPSRVAD
jgi:competence protein ComEA